MMSTDTPCSRFAFSHMPTQLFPWELRMNHYPAWCLLTSQTSSWILFVVTIFIVGPLLQFNQRPYRETISIQYSSLSFQELSRKELRPLRQKLSSIRKMKRCGKRIQLHCDPDGNASITQQEWLACVLKHSGKDTFLFYGKNEYSGAHISWHKCIFSPFLSLCQTAWWPYRVSHIDALCINLFY